MPEEKIIRRAPSIHMRISELNQSGVRVAIVGTVVSKNSELGSFILDDGESSILVLTNNFDDFEQLKEGQFVRVLGRTWGTGDELELQADIIQDFSKIDKELFQKVFYSQN